MSDGMNATDFDARGAAYQRALRILCETFLVPPSLEQLQHEIDLRRVAEPGISPEGVARVLTYGYRPRDPEGWYSHLEANGER